MRQSILLDWVLSFVRCSDSLMRYIILLVILFSSLLYFINILTLGNILYSIYIYIYIQYIQYIYIFVCYEANSLIRYCIFGLFYKNIL